MRGKMIGGNSRSGGTQPERISFSWVHLTIIPALLLALAQGGRTATASPEVVRKPAQATIASSSGWTPCLSEPSCADISGCLAYCSACAVCHGFIEPIRSHRQLARAGAERPGGAGV
jgi:hypothetical protein